MADVTSLEFKKDTLGTGNSATYSATKTVGNKTCTIFVNDRTKNGFGKDDFFFYDGDISLFSQKEIKDLVDKGADGKKYDANNVDKKVNRDDLEKLVKMDTCKDLEKGKYYELGSVFDCATKAEEKIQTEAKAKADAEAAAKAKAEADAKAAEAAKTAPPATPAATEKPVAAKAEKPIPPPPAKAPAQNDNQQYYQQQWAQPVSYGPSPAEMMGTSALAGGAIGGIIGFLFGGSRGFFGGAIGGALGGLMSFCGMSGFGGGMMCGGFGGGYDDGMASLDGALNMTFARGMNNMAAIMSQPIYVAPVQNRQAPPPSNLS